MVRVLIVEDEPVIRELLDDFLSDEGFDTIHAADGLRGVELAHHEHPDLVLMDLMLPGLDGFAATRALKNSPDTAAIPIVAMSTNRWWLRLGIDLPADDTIRKPFDLDDLLERVLTQTSGRWAASQRVALTG